GFALGDHDVDADTVQQPDRRLVDSGVKHGLDAAGEQRDAATLFRLGREGARPFRDGAAMRETWRKLEHGTDALEAWHLADRPRKGARRGGADKREAEPVAMRQDGRERGANDAIGERPAIRLLDMRAGMIDEVHV